MNPEQLKPKQLEILVKGVMLSQFPRIVGKPNCQNTWNILCEYIKEDLGIEGLNLQIIYSPEDITHTKLTLRIAYRKILIREPIILTS